MLRRDTKTGDWKIAGIGVVRPIDANERAAKRSAKATENPLQGIFSQSFKMPSVEQRCAAITGRDNLFQRERMEPAYQSLGEKLLTGKTAGNLVAHRVAARELKPEVAMERLRATLPADMKAMKDALSDAVVSHVAKRLIPARDALRAAILPDPVADPAIAAANAVLAGEIRSRLAAMTPGDKAKQVMRWAEAGNLDALAAVRSDPFGLPCSPEVMEAADAKALGAIGGSWLGDDYADAVEECQTLAALADVIYNTVQTELRDAGVPAELLRDSLNATQWLTGQLQ